MFSSIKKYSRKIKMYRKTIKCNTCYSSTISYTKNKNKRNIVIPCCKNCM